MSIGRILTKGLSTGMSVGGIEYILRRGLSSADSPIISGLLIVSKVDRVSVTLSVVDRFVGGSRDEGGGGY